MALKYASITCELREIVLRNKPKEMISISKKATVPVFPGPQGEIRARPFVSCSSYMAIYTYFNIAIYMAWASLFA